jgi:hypothetical protein
VDADPLYMAIEERSNRHEVTYRSALNSSGQHTIKVLLGEASAEAVADLEIDVPRVTLPLDNSRPIRRVAADEDTPFSQMEPTTQPLVAQVSWPDDHPRRLESASLLVNAVEVPLDQSVLDDSGMLTFEWDIRELDAGVYVLQVKVTDELNLDGVSEPLPLTIEIDRPEAPEATATAPPPEPIPAVPEEEDAVFFGLSATALTIIGGAVVLMLLTIVIIGGVFFSRRRPAPTPIPAPPPPAGQMPPIAGQASFDPSVTQVMPPDFAMDEFAVAYLEVLENAPEHSALIPLTSNNVALGRDPKRVDVVFGDKSVSRLHARIVESQGAFRIYDEGSASGTYVNYERTSLTPRTLNDKDDVHFGRVHVRFHLGSSLSQGESTQIFGPGEEAGADTQIY